MLASSFVLFHLFLFLFWLFGNEKGKFGGSAIKITLLLLIFFKKKQKGGDHLLALVRFTFFFLRHHHHYARALVIAATAVLSRYTHTHTRTGGI
jgi:hypothetical protein